MTDNSHGPSPCRYRIPGTRGSHIHSVFMKSDDLNECLLDGNVISTVSEDPALPVFTLVPLWYQTMSNDHSQTTCSF